MTDVLIYDQTLVWNGSGYPSVVTPWVFATGFTAVTQYRWEVNADTDYEVEDYVGDATSAGGAGGTQIDHAGPVFTGVNGGTPLATGPGYLWIQVTVNAPFSFTPLRSAHIRLWVVIGTPIVLPGGSWVAVIG